MRIDSQDGRLNQALHQGHTIEEDPVCKLTPRYVGSLEVPKFVPPVAYRITLPDENWRIHNVLHVLA